MHAFLRLPKPNLLFGLSAAFWAILFLLGGGARADIQSLVVLRPLAALFLAYGLWGLTKQDIQSNKFLFGFVGVSTLLVVLHLVPLPHGLWSNLPGRGLIAEADTIAEIGAIWRPLSLLPTDSWNALFAMLIPITVVVLVSRLTLEQRNLFLGLTLLVGLFTAFLGILQVLGPDGGPLYFYRITNRGTAVGLFANRNHHAVFLACLIPMLAVFASTATSRFGKRSFRLGASVSAGAILFLLIVISGSRAGLLVALLGICAVPILYMPDKRSKNDTPNFFQISKLKSKILIPAIAVLAVITVTILSSRAVSFSRLFGNDGQGELRFEVWSPIAEQSWAYFPFGSGIGTFADVYKIHENRSLLQPEYLNHAHNDLLELLMTAGLPGLILLLVAAFAWSKRSYAVFFRERVNCQSLMFARLGSVIILMLSIASLGDYPLRTPSLSGLLVLAAIWMTESKKASVPDDRGK